MSTMQLAQRVVRALALSTPTLKSLVALARFWLSPNRRMHQTFIKCVGSIS